MKEREQINDMLKQGTLNPEQAKLLEDSIRESKSRRVKLAQNASSADETPSVRTIWMIICGLFLCLILGLVFAVKYKPLFFLLLLIVFAFGCSAAIFLLFFNILIWKKEDVTRAQALIHNEVDRKEALVPQIWDAVSEFAKNEAGIYENVTKARVTAEESASDTSAQLDKQINAIQALVESNPEIKSNQTYVQLFNQLVETENRITAMAAWHNQKVHSFNSTVESFPFSIVAAAFSFQKTAYFGSDS